MYLIEKRRWIYVLSCRCYQHYILSSKPPYSTSSQKTDYLLTLPRTHLLKILAKTGSDTSGASQPIIISSSSSESSLFHQNVQVKEENASPQSTSTSDHTNKPSTSGTMCDKTSLKDTHSFSALTESGSDYSDSAVNTITFEIIHRRQYLISFKIFTCK